jgi:hypothetical protein
MSSTKRIVVIVLTVVVILAVVVGAGIAVFELKFEKDKAPVNIHYDWHHSWIREMRDVVRVLNTVKDQESADAAAHAIHIEALGVDQMYERLIRLPELSNLQRRLLPNDYQPTQQRLQNQIADLMKKAQAFHDGQSRFSTSFDKLREALGKIQSSPQRYRVIRNWQ